MSGPAGQRPHRRDEVFDVHPRAAVDVRRPLPRHDADAHGVTLGGGTMRARRANAPFTGYVASHAWRSSGARHRPGRRCGEAACSPHRRPGQAGGAVRRQLPADRLRALQPRERRDPADRRPDAVQEPQPRPAHHADLADVAAARQLRDPGAGAAAARPALVHRQRRRDLPEPQPDLRRAARHRRRLRRRPRVPHGPGPDGRPAPADRCRGDHRRAARAAEGGHGVRRHRRRRRGQGARLPGEAGRPAGAAGLARGELRLHGQLRVHHRRPARGAAHRRRGRVVGARHGRLDHADARRRG